MHIKALQQDIAYCTYIILHCIGRHTCMLDRPACYYGLDSDTYIFVGTSQWLSLSCYTEYACGVTAVSGQHCGQKGDIQLYLSCIMYKCTPCHCKVSITCYMCLCVSVVGHSYTPTHVHASFFEIPVYKAARVLCSATCTYLTQYVPILTKDASHCLICYRQKFKDTFHCVYSLCLHH